MILTINLTSATKIMTFFCVMSILTVASEAKKLTAPELWLPQNGIRISETSKGQGLSFTWNGSKESKKYRIEIGLDAGMKNIINVATVNHFQYNLPNVLKNRTLYWHVAAIDSTGEQGPWSPAGMVTIGYPERAALAAPMTITDEHVLGVVSLAQRKDTKMLCLDWHYGDGTVNGCELNNSNGHPWDGPHTNAQSFCEHDHWKCWAAEGAMINHYYGGNITIDEINYYEMTGRQFQSNAGLPEGDFMHGSLGGQFGSVQKIVLAWLTNLEWKGTAGNTNFIDLYVKPTESSIRTIIDNGKPIIFTNGAHLMVLDGYRMNGSTFEVRLANLYMNGEQEFVDYSSILDFRKCMYVNVPVPTPRMTDSRIALDSDGDGVCDFDEEERFKTNKYKVDSDNDGINDKIEIFSYSVVRGIDSNSVDVDHDGLRSEKDFNTDGGALPDGYEDLNANGILNTGETDPYLASDDGTLPTDLIVSNVTINTQQLFLARNSITAGPAVTINSGAKAIFAARNRIDINSGFQQNGGEITIKIDSNLGP